MQSLALEDGDTLTARNVLSSIGYVETMNLLSENDASASGLEAGQLSFVKSIMVLDRQPSELGLDTTIVFFNNSDRFNYRKPDSPIDTSSGVICCPNNFQYGNPLPEGKVRITNMANFDRWNSLSASRNTERRRSRA